MSTQPLDSTAGAPAGYTAALARIAQIEQMVAQASTGLATDGATAAPGAASSTSFSSVLASAASAAPQQASGVQATYAPTIEAAAAAYGIDPGVLMGLVNQESGFDPNAVSSAGAEGLTQVMPENFASDGITDPFDPTQSIYGGAKQLSEDLSEFGGNYTDALAAYNAGSAAVQQYGGVPPYAQTQNYVADILSYAQSYDQQAVPATQETTLPTTITGAIA